MRMATHVGSSDKYVDGELDYDAYLHAYLQISNVYVHYINVSN